MTDKKDRKRSASGRFTHSSDGRWIGDQLGAVLVPFICPFGSGAPGPGGGMGPGKYVPSNIFSRSRISSGVDGGPPLTIGCSGVGVISPLVWLEIMSAFDGVSAGCLLAAGTVLSCTVLLQAVIARNADANKKENPNVFFKIIFLSATDWRAEPAPSSDETGSFHRCYLVDQYRKSLVSRVRPKMKNRGSVTFAALFV